MTDPQPTRTAGDTQVTDVHAVPDAPASNAATRIDDASAAPAPTARVAGGSGGGSARRWGIALVVVALVIGVVAAGVFLLAGSSTPSAVLGYAPRDSVTYVSARLDLPGDQRQKVGELLSRFPGFADQSTLETKIDEVLDRLVGEASDGDQTFSGDIKPWFGGEVGVAVGRLPEAPADPEDAFDTGEALLLVSVTDAAAARAWFDGLTDEPTSTETHGGVELVVSGDDGAVMGIVDGRVMIVGDETSVKAAIDRGGQNGLDTNEQYSAAAETTTGASLGTFYVDTASYLAWVEANGGAMGGDLSGLGGFGFDVDDMPAWVAGRLRAESDALVVDVVAPKVEGASERANRLSAIADNLPANTLFVGDIHDAGAALADLVEEVRANPETAEAFREMESAVALLGGFDGLIGWIGDAAIVVAGSESDLGGGLVLSATDPAGAERFSSTLRGLLALGGAQLGVETRDETYNGATVTYLDVGALAEGMGGVDAEIPEIGWTVVDDVLVIGAGEDFLHAVIDTTAETSLASNARYAALIERAGRENFASTWIDVTALRGVLESIAVEQGDFAGYEADVKPYLEPIDAIVGASVVGDDFDRSTLILSVK